MGNTILSSLTVSSLLERPFGVDIAQLQTDAIDSINGMASGTWFIARHDNHTLSLIHFIDHEVVDGKSTEANPHSY